MPNLYEVRLSQNSEQFLYKLDKHIKGRILNRLRRLSENPIPTDSKFLGREEGEKLFRYRIGNYRALYKIKENLRIILITKIDKRPKVY